MNYKISIVVSMYNVEMYIEKCIQSLVNQTLKGIEIILVNDGSNDRTKEIAEKYANFYENVILINKENGGLSSARNMGMKVAKGEYIAFVDGDDFVMEDMYELMYKSAYKNQADMVMIGYKRYFENQGFVEDQELHNNPIFINNIELISPNNKVISDILMPMIGSEPTTLLDITLNMCVWRNIYKRKILLNNNIKFISERVYISEDIVFHLELLNYINSVSIVNKSGYVYRCNDNSLTQSYRKDRFEKECFLYSFLKNNHNSKINYDDFILRLNRTFIGKTRYCILSEVKSNKDEKISKRMINIKKILNNATLIDILKDYPIKELPFKLRIYTNFMKKKRVIPLVIMSIIKH